MNITKTTAQNYWRRNIRLIAGLLTLWFASSYGIVILFGDFLSGVPFFGTSLPFWFGQQGSILTFLGILIIYAIKMDQMNAWLEAQVQSSASLEVEEKEAA